MWYEFGAGSGSARNFNPGTEGPEMDNSDFEFYLVYILRSTRTT